MSPEFQELYRKAIAREGQSRDAAFLGIPEKVNGVLVKPFTLRHLTVLSLVNSPFLRFKDDLDDEQLTELTELGFITREDCAIFLWNVSTQFRPLRSWWDRLQYRRFMKQQHALDVLLFTKGIFAYIREAFEDAPASTGKKTVSYYSQAASVVDWLASEYGWSDDEILDKPLKRVWQYMRVVGVREGSKAPMFNKSDKVKGDYLRSLKK